MKSITVRLIDDSTLGFSGKDTRVWYQGAFAIICHLDEYIVYPAHRIIEIIEKNITD